MARGDKIFEFDRKVSTNVYHPSYYFREIQAMNDDMTRIKAFHKTLDDKYWRDFKAVIRAEGLGDPDKVIAWAQRKARECERTGRPMVTGQSLERVFVLKLARGSETM